MTTEPLLAPLKLKSTVNYYESVGAIVALGLAVFSSEYMLG